MLPTLPYQSLLLQCRPGFESDCAAEISDRADGVGVAGYCRTQAGSGHLAFHAGAPAQLGELLAELDLGGLIFPRQWLACLAFLEDLPPSDRIAPILHTLEGLREFSDVFIEYPDTNAGKELSTFCRKFRPPLLRALQQAGIRCGRRPHAARLHLFFLDSARVYVGLSDPRQASPWPLGIPRLRLPRQAPSRSTLKLDEALQVFLDADAQAQRLRSGMTAVDLGAAPGGWSWQLARRGLHVTAVDNGGMDPVVMATGMVEHLRADGFRYRPRRPVDWLVCDMVEQPTRIAGLMADWLVRRDCREAIFNLKLPMKKRYQTVQECLQLVQRRLRRAGIPHQLACRQLYHDREEVTVHVATGD